MQNKKKHDVLVLNRSWVAIHIVWWGKGISLIYQEKCRALDKEFIAYSYKDWRAFTLANAKNYTLAKTANYSVAVPEVIVSTTFDKLPDRQVKYTRQNIFIRDKFKCMYCRGQFNRNQLTLDHIIPRCQGGRSTWDNIVASCFKCNQIKSDKTPEQAGLTLKAKPKKPSWITPLDNVNVTIHPCTSWKHFLMRV